jgi:nucleoside-diphosphate-sugar epimerase
VSVLVVGGSGYLGRAVCLALEAAGHQVVALSRSGGASAGEPVRGDATRYNLGLSRELLTRTRAETTHIVSCFGSVDWGSGPAGALDLHAAGTRSVLRFAGECRRLSGLVHVSSLLVLGRAEGRVGNRELYVGQRFRNWYEYGKYAAEALVRGSPIPSTILRFGPLLGPDPAGRPLGARDGLLAAVPFLVQGYPVHLERGGGFPCYTGDVTGAAAVVVRAVERAATGSTWTWFDPELPSLASVLHALCRPWGRVPRIVDARLIGVLQRLVAGRVGVPPALLDYTEPWFDVDPAVLAQIPDGPPSCRPGYLDATGQALRQPGSDLTGTFA